LGKYLAEKEIELATLKNQVSEWENVTSEKELGIISLKNEIQMLKNELKAQNQSNKEVFDKGSKDQELHEDKSIKKKEQTREIKPEDKESKKEEGLSEQVLPSTESQNERQTEKYEEPLLTQEEIVERLKHSHQHGIPVPAKNVGGKRIKQNSHGPHITHKATLVEERDEKNPV